MACLCFLLKKISILARCVTGFGSGNVCSRKLPRIVPEVNNTIRCEMEIKQEDPFSENVVSQNETEFFAMNRNSDDWTIKSETSPKYFVKQIKCETVTCGNNWEIDMRTETEEETIVPNFGSQNEREFLPGMKLWKIKSDHVIDSKMEIKEEAWWLETETSSICDDIRDGNLPPVTSSRLCIGAVSGTSSDKSSLPSVEVSGRHTSFYNGKDHLEFECQKSDVREMLTAGEHVFSEQCGKCSERREKFIRPLYLKQNSLIHKNKKAHKCNICAKDFSCLSHLKTHNLIHEGKKPHQCKTCDKSFTQLSHLKRHNLVHEGKKPHQCKTCDKSFSQVSHLKTHNLIHEGKKPYQCKTCEKSFTRMSHLNTHNLIHEGKKPHQCKSCDKSFTQIGDLKRHNFIHEGTRPHQCKTCDKSFTRLSILKKHNLIHEGKYQ